MAFTGLGTEVAIYCPSLDDAGNGTGTLTDLSALHSDGTITGASWVADTDSGGVRALEFDGVEDLVAIANIGFGSDPWSIGLWVKFINFNDYAPLVAFTSGSEFYEPGIYGNNQDDSNHRFGSWWQSVDSDNGYDSTGTFDADQWYHVGVSFGNDGIMRYYIDGVAQGSTNWGSVSTGNSTIYLGHQPPPLFGRLRLDDIRFFDVALPVEDFETLATSRGEGLEPAFAAVATITEADDTLDSTGSVLVTAEAAIAEADDVVEASSVTPRFAEATITEADDTLEATGNNYPNFGEASLTEADDTLDATGSSSRTAAANITEADDTLDATGQNYPNFGDVNLTEADDTLQSIATLPVTAVAMITEGDDTIDSASRQDAIGDTIFLRGIFVASQRPQSMFLGV